MLLPSLAYAEWCEPPSAPTPTSAELAREFRDEFKGEFEKYFSEASAYVACLDTERTRALNEIGYTAQRYERFLSDETTWNAEP